MKKEYYSNTFKLKPCCTAALKVIESKISLGKLLKVVVGSSSFLTLFASNPADALFTISTTDWDLLGRATKAVSSMEKKSCIQIAEIHALDHYEDDVALYDFWLKIANSFRD